MGNQEQVYFKDSFLSNPVSELVVDENCANVGYLERINQPLTVQFAVENEEEITIFSKQLSVPSKVVTLDGVLPKIQNELGFLKEGNVVLVEFVPQDNFKCTIGYET